MKIRLLSDLHAEGGLDKNLLKTQGEDVLVIAGDLHVGADKVWTLLKQFAEEQPNIVYTPGNHEFYRQNYYEVCDKLEDWSEYTNIKFLNPGTVHYDTFTKRFSDFQTRDTVAFICAPLWTNFRNNELSKFHASRGINDFRLIEFGDRYFNPEDAVYLYDLQYGYIKQQYEELKCKKVIVTHFLPAVESIDPQFIGCASSTLNDYFANDLGGWINTLENTTWCHGHTHSNVDVTIGSTRLLANPYGYGKNYNYKECLIDI